MRKLLSLLALLTLSFAGAQDYSGIVKNYLQNNRSQLGLTTGDVENVALKSNSFSKSMNVQNVYVNQSINGIEVFNSTSSFAIRNGQVVHANVGFAQDLSAKINASAPSTTPVAAISSAAIALGLNSPANLQLIEGSGTSFRYTNGGISLNEIPVQLVYQKMDNDSYRLAWDLSIYLIDGSHYYSARIDAQSGQLLDTIDWVNSCDFGDRSHSHKNDQSVLFKEENASIVGGAEYRVFGLPFRNPFDGDDAIETSPEDLTASPFGWHDTDGTGGAEYTITRGNNVWAKEDIDGNNATIGASPDGGPTLSFDFAYGLPQEPENFTEAATVNLFYWNNIIHDITYQYGFDEESGNFQENNYGNPGNEGDSVNADAQDGGGTNNANFATPPDGQNPRMQMFIWDPAGLVELLTINNGPLAGGYQAVAANYGAPMPVAPLTADMAVVIDDNSGTSTDPNDACDPITNGGDLSGKIAVIRRGECEFGFKSLAAQNEGAIAVVMVNNVAGDPIPMGGGAVGGSVTIPCLMISNSDGEALIAEVLANSTNGTIQAVELGPNLDGDLDNEIIAHEYAHGVSNRLTGGPANSGCLGNDEQMGEGWSDYLGLILTMQADDTGDFPRGLGNYASGRGPDGFGIREAPYTTDMSINDYTYADVNGNVSVPHGVGFVWNSMLWEMTWALIDEYGFDPDIYNGTGGNNIALQLVMDAMKLQPCSPGFADGRDAILQADELANGGANFCIIWNAFAKRGMGLTASQGSPFSLSDGTEAFDVPAECSTLGASDFNFDNNFTIYPNPTSGTINISSKVSLGLTNVSIIDMNGRVVFLQDMELGNNVSFDVSNLSAGIYLVKVDGGNYTHTSKLIIR